MTSPDQRKKHRITSLDIAHRAGVSQATVSRVLSGSTLVSPETRRRVEEAVRELNYKVDRHASSLRTQRASTLALLLFEDPTADDSGINPFFLAILGSVTRAAARYGQDLLVSFQQSSDDWHADYEDSMKADGLILLGYGDYVTHRAKLELLVAQDTHFVRWGAVLPDQPGITLGCDNLAGGRLAGQHLASLGRERVAFIGDASEHAPEFQARHAGFVEAMMEAGKTVDPALQVDAESTEESGYAAAQALLARGLPFDGLFAACDLIALGAMRALREHGLHVPRDVAVIGFDGISSAAYATPPLTTVAQDTTGAGELLVAALMAQIRGEPVQQMMLAPTLVVRESSGIEADG